MYDSEITYKIIVKGLVQGVGFRPFIYRIAHLHKIKGTVENNSSGVIIFAQGKNNSLKHFISDIISKRPPASFIDDIAYHTVEKYEFEDFRIVKSTDDDSGITKVSPDIAVCEDCLHDIKNQSNRIDYPLTNCTNCGPRFTIIKDIPYDRRKTTMSEFLMCSDCSKEYNDVLDRRFHAQPVACNNCGPKYQYKSGGIIKENISEICKNTAQIIDSGGTALIKGLGGYFLTADAHNFEAVEIVRNIKKREAKPFAVMAKSIDAAKKYVYINDFETEILNSFRKPVVLCQRLKKSKSKKSLQLISSGMNTLGILLPYMPFHYLLFEELKTDLLVFTSGNISDEPILINDEIAEKEFAEKVDCIISYNREIYNRTDDSVVSCFGDRLNIIRRSRGYVPEPISYLFKTEGIFGAGAELVNTFAIGKDKDIILSQHIGDLKNFDTYEFYRESFKRFKRLFRFSPELVVYDKHPDYLSSRFAIEFGLETVAVQHHHSHMASCMAENGLDEKVIGVIMDGTGLGDDGNIWGSEFFVGDYLNYSREYHFEYIKLPGGDLAVKEPWRIAFSYLHKYGMKNHHIDFLNEKKEEIILLGKMLEKNLNSPLSCGAGRLFDAVAALTGVCTNAQYHSQAPMLLESLIQKEIENKYNYEIDNNEVVFKRMFDEILFDIKKAIPASIISTKFHNTIISVIFEIVKKLKNKFNINKVVLSGGSFQNRYITTNLIELLEKNNFKVFTQQKVPANDAGISLGQIAIASKRRATNVS
jgi:hydrogenase maturation protein HypF